jgi:GTP1/Obg family GTP-binding protein
MIWTIVRKLEISRDELQNLMAAAEEAAARRQKEWEEEQERYRHEEDQRRVAEARAESQKQLSDIMNKWAAAMSVERFFDEAEKRIEGLESGRRNQLARRLALARDMLGTLDPLDYLGRWLAPEERYKSKYSSN